MLNFGVTVNALIHYLLLYITYKTKNDTLVNPKSVCGGTDKCMKYIKRCFGDYYSYDMEGFEKCFTKRVFGIPNDIVDFQNKTDYYEKMNKVRKNKEEFKEIYFELMLNNLKECAENKEIYDKLFDYIQWSIYFIEEKINNFIKDNNMVDIIEDEEVKRIADRLFYIDKFSQGKLYDTYLGTREGNKYINYIRKFFENDIKSDYSQLYEVNNEKYFDNKQNIKDIKDLDYNFNGYNLEQIVSESFANKTALEKFNEDFLMKYADSIDVLDMVKKMANDVETEHNVFNMIYSLSKTLNREAFFRYVFDKNNNHMDELDLNSFYENAGSFSEVVYNLVYEYYDLIYQNSLKDKDSNTSRIIYRLDGPNISYIERFGNTIDKIEYSNFYNDIYNTILYLKNKN